MSTWKLLQTIFHRSLHDLRTLVPSYCLFCVLVLVICGIALRYFRFEIYQKKSTKQFPIHPWMNYLRAIIIGRNRLGASFLEFVHGVSRLYRKEGMYGICFGPVKYLFLYNHHAVEFALKSRVSFDKGSEYHFLRPYVNDSIFICSYEKWHLRRKQLTPAFHFRSIDQYIDVFNKQGRILVENIVKLMEKEKRVEIFEVVGLTTFDSILETSMGINVKDVDEKRNKYLQAFHEGAGIISKRVVLPWHWVDFIFWRTKQGKILRKSKDFMENFIKEIVQEKKRLAIERLSHNKSKVVTEQNSSESGAPKQVLCLTDLLMNLHLKGNSVSIDEMVEEIQTFIIGARDTSAVAISWTLFFLGHHQDIQRKVQNEIDELLGDDIDRTITKEDCGSLKFLKCVFKESLRLCPPGGIISRNLLEDAVINGYTVPKGTNLVILMYVLHRDPEVFPNPEEFIPERFSEKNSAKMHPFSYVPFSAGPRNCIGQRYAKYSTIIFLATVLRHFNVESLDNREKINVKFDFVPVPENGIHLKFTKRSF